MRLLKVELERFRARRAIVLTVLAATILAAVMVGTTLYGTRAVSPEAMARAEQRAAAEADERYVVRELNRCEQDPESYFGAGAETADCQQLLPQAEWYLDRAVLSLREERGDTGMALIFLLVGVAIIVGTTFSGADWASGSMGNQLLFEPRRVKVWVIKAVAVMIGVAVFAGVLLAAFWGVLFAAAEMRDISTSPAVVTEIWQTAARGVALASAASLGAFALTMTFRSTVGTLGLLLGYAVAGEALAATLPITKISQWALSANVQAWLSDGIEVYDDSLCQDLLSRSGSCDPTYLLTLEHAAAYLGAMVALAVVLSVLAFRRRDVP